MPSRCVSGIFWFTAEAAMWSHVGVVIVWSCRLSSSLHMSQFLQPDVTHDIYRDTCNQCALLLFSAFENPSDISHQNPSTFPISEICHCILSHCFPMIWLFWFSRMVKSLERKSTKKLKQRGGGPQSQKSFFAVAGAGVCVNVGCVLCTGATACHYHDLFSRQNGSY